VVTGIRPGRGRNRGEEACGSVNANGRAERPFRPLREALDDAVEDFVMRRPDDRNLVRVREVERQNDTGSKAPIKSLWHFLEHPLGAQRVRYWLSQLRDE